MPSLFFPNLNALRLVLSSGLIPTDLTRAPASAGFDPHGRLWLEITAFSAREIISAMSRVGVQAVGKIAVPTEPVRCWAELLPLRKTSSPDQASFLFLGPDRQAPSFIAKLRKATKKPFGIELRDEPIDRTALISIVNPPQRFLADIAEQIPSFECFTEQSTGIWVQAGWEHPLPSELVVPEHSFLLFRPPRSVLVASGTVPELAHEEYRFSRARSRPLVKVDHKI